MNMIHRRATRFAPAFTPIAAALISIGLCTPCVLAAPQGGTVQAGAATIQQSGPRTRITQSTHRAVIDWRAFGVGANEQVAFLQPSRQSATLNRVNGDQLSSILGRIDATGQVFLVNPHGIVIGNGAQINVGGFVASTANISNENFMQGRLVFDQPGVPGARIVNQGAITAAESGLVALVAPSVQNDGVIQARLGKVAIGAGDTFTIDLQGDGLINLALSPQHRDQIQAAGGGPLITQSGRIEADGGKVVLITAPLAAAVLDEVINMGGSIRADSVAQQGGRIVLLGSGGKVNVGGALSAQGTETGTSGGKIDVLGDMVQLAGGARVDAGGQAGGGAIHVGGNWQGKGDTYRAKQTRVDAGATLNADAQASGNGGEVVLWSDGNTGFAGQVSARGGTAFGNGGRVEVSGKGSLDFAGEVVANAAHGEAGLLLLDPAYLNIGSSEAGLINRVLRTGTSTRLVADVDINVNSMIDGRGGRAGGGLSMSAGRDVALNQSVVTNGGGINIAAGGAIRSAAGTGLFSLGGGIFLTGDTGIVSGDAVAGGGSINLTSRAGPIRLNGDLVTAGAGNIDILAQNGSIEASPGAGIYAGTAKVTMAAGSTASATRLDAGQIATTGGAVDLTSGTGGMAFHEAITTRGGAFSATSGGALDSGTNGVFTLTGPITLTGGSVTVSGPLATSGETTLRSTGGDVVLNSPVGKENGALTIQSAGAVYVNAPVLNIASGAPFQVWATGNITIARGIEGGRESIRGGPVWLLSDGGDILLKSNIASNGGEIVIDSNSGRVLADENTFVSAAGAPVRIFGDKGVTTGIVDSISVERPNDPTNASDRKEIQLISGHGDVRLGGNIRRDSNEEIFILSGKRILANSSQFVETNGTVTVKATESIERVGVTGNRIDLEGMQIQDVVLSIYSGGARLNGHADIIQTSAYFYTSDAQLTLQTDSGQQTIDNSGKRPGDGFITVTSSVERRIHDVRGNCSRPDCDELGPPSPPGPGTRDVLRLDPAAIPDVPSPQFAMGDSIGGDPGLSENLAASESLRSARFAESDGFGSEAIPGTGSGLVFEGGRGPGQEADLGRSAVGDTRTAAFWAFRLAARCLFQETCGFDRE
jgi:filamentous hemagglutinin family protein